MQRESAKPPLPRGGEDGKSPGLSLFGPLPLTPLCTAQTLTKQRSNGCVLRVLHPRVYFCTCDTDNVWKGFCMFSIRFCNCNLPGLLYLPVTRPFLFTTLRATTDHAPSLPRYPIHPETASWKTRFWQKCRHRGEMLRTWGCFLLGSL